MGIVGDHEDQPKGAGVAVEVVAAVHGAEHRRTRTRTGCGGIPERRRAVELAVHAAEGRVDEQAAPALADEGGAEEIGGLGRP